MSLFTSNFRSESKVLLTLVAVAAACELGLRIGSERLSSDIAHIRSIPAVAAALRGRDGEQLLFLGNSLTREGVDLATVRGELQCGPAGVSAESVHPDDTTILDWYYLYRNNFSSENALDWMVIPFVRGQLSDGTTIHPDRIAAYFGGWANAEEMLRFDLTSLGDRIGYLLASSLRLFSERERVRDRVLSVAIPDYRRTATRLNEAVRRESARRSPDEKPTYTRLVRLLGLARQRGVRAAFVAMPVPQPYGLDPGLQAVLAQNGGELLDMRDTKELSAADYADRLHLSPSGAKTFSRILGGRLRNLVCKPAPAGEKPATGGAGNAGARTPARISEAIPQNWMLRSRGPDVDGDMGNTCDC